MDANAMDDRGTDDRLALQRSIDMIRRYSRSCADVETRRRLIPIERCLVWSLMVAEAGGNAPTIIQAIEDIAGITGA